MSRTYDQIPPPESAISAAACGRTIRDTSVPDSLLPVSPAGVDLGAEAAALEAGQVSALLAARMLSLTNLTYDALPWRPHHS